MLGNHSQTDLQSQLAQSYDAHFNHLREVYDRALDNHHFESLIVYSGAIKKQFLDDIPYPFFVNLQFKAIVPLCDAPESWVVWIPSDKPLLLLFQPEDFWHGTPDIPSTFWSSYFEIIPINEKEDAQQYFGNTKHCAFLGESNESIQSWDLGQHNPDALIAELNWYRSYKTVYEQYCVAEANRITVQGHAAAQEAFYTGASELEIALAFQQACEQPEEQLAFASIIGINENAGILHYSGRDTNRIAADKRHSLLIDAGATYNGYAADTCRTYAYRDGLYAEMITALDTAQQTIVKALKVGTQYIDNHVLTMHQLAGLLKEFQIINLEPDSAVELDLIKYFMPHNVSHFLGLQVHDVGGNQADITGTLIDSNEPKHKMRRAIEANQILTVEPGIYFIDILLKSLAKSKHRNVIGWDRIEQLKPYGGMRIEDNLLITTEGPVNFTRDAFNEITTKTNTRKIV
jgi:Xaa-Pro dipeptidase